MQERAPVLTGAGAGLELQERDVGTPNIYQILLPAAFEDDILLY